jgi:hypothetical protein
MSILSGEVKVARVRLAAAHAASEEDGGTAFVGAAAAPGAPAPAPATSKALAPHVRAQLDGFDRPGEPGSGRAAHAAAAAAEAAAAAGPAPPTSFLAAAGERSRLRDLDRRRAVIADSARAQGGGGGGAARAAGLPAVAFTVNYRYHEGFTNAVRRPVRVRDFLRAP